MNEKIVYLLFIGLTILVIIGASVSGFRNTDVFLEYLDELGLVKKPRHPGLSAEQKSKMLIIRIAEVISSSRYCDSSEFERLFVRGQVTKFIGEHWRYIKSCLGEDLFVYKVLELSAGTGDAIVDINGNPILFEVVKVDWGYKGTIFTHYWLNEEIVSLRYKYDMITDPFLYYKN